MTTIGSVGAGSGTSSVKQAQMAKDDFLKMLIVQLKNQDPLNPMDGTEFTAQLAQFSSLEQLANLNGQIESMNARQAMMDNIGSVNLIGKSVLTDSNTIVADGGTVELSYRLNDAIESGVLEIYHPEGTVVDTIELGGSSPGEYTYQWDSSGFTDGNYAFRLTAENEYGGYAAWTPLIMGVVTGVTFRDGGAYLSVNGEEIPLETVKVVKQSAQK